MKRKFRVWDKNNNKMYPTDYELIKELYFDMYGNIEKIIIAKYISEGNWNFEVLENFELQESLGVEDKNGKEIFEGDIIKVYGGLHEVKYSEWCLGFIPFVSKGIVQNEVENEFEIVGNAFENPSMIEGE